jgi:His-Xaa-Ser system protein HxsD
MRFTVSARNNEVSFSLPKKLNALELVQGAAHVLTDRATAFVEESKTDWKLTLSAKRDEGAAGLRALGREFVDEVLNQAVRQRLVANARPVFEHIVSRAVVSARRNPEDKDQPAAARDAELSAADKAELERLVAEAEAELAARRKGGALKETAKTWEERHGHPRTGR